GRLGGPDIVVCARRRRDEEKAARRFDELALLRRDPRHRSGPLAAARLSQQRRAHAGELARETLLAAMPARQLVLPAVASRLRPGVRAEYPRGGRRIGRTRRLGAALLELLQAQPVQAAACLLIAGLARRARRQSALRAAALRSERRRRRFCA